MIEKGTNKFVRINIIIECIAVCNLVLGMFTRMSMEKTSGLAVYGCALLIDVLILSIVMPKHFERLAIGMRYFIILGLSVYIVFFFNENMLAISVLLLLSQIFDLVFRIDFTDMYSRLIVMSVSAFPIALLTIVEQLFFTKGGNSYTIEIISVVATLIVMITTLSKIFIDWVTSYERKFLEQRRKNENANETNENLLNFQEKLRKVNEEIGIQKIRVEAANRQVSRANAEMKVQNEVLKYVSSSIEQKEMMKEATRALRETMNLKFCALALHDGSDETKTMYQECHDGISDEFMEYLKECITVKEVQRIEKLTDIYIEKALQPLYQHALKQQDELAVIIVVPVFCDNRVEGVIVCGHERQDYFDESRTVFQNVATQLILAWNNARLYAKMQQMAIRDGLTGLYNRRQLNQLVDTFCQTATENHMPLTAALVDIDNFKSFNDTYGHAFGDLVLKELAGIIDACATQHEGISARYGGEEFVLVFPEKNMDESYELISILRETINRTTLDYSGQPVSIHASIGISSYPETAEQPQAVLNRADAAMYFAKQHGKNRITRDSDEVLMYFRKNAKGTE